MDGLTDKHTHFCMTPAVADCKILCLPELFSSEMACNMTIPFFLHIDIYTVDQTEKLKDELQGITAENRSICYTILFPNSAPTPISATSP